jgi:hypothetical protein
MARISIFLSEQHSKLKNLDLWSTQSKLGILNRPNLSHVKSGPSELMFQHSGSVSHLTEPEC